jgi:bacterioferritin
MGTKAKEIVDVDVEKLITLLNKAYADEWLAYYQYFTGAKVAEGMLRGPIAGELMEHAKEEFEHAEKLANRIITLGGTPILDPEELKKISNCGYETPSDPDTITLLKQNIEGEQCAIDVYKAMMKYTKDKDVITYHLALEILEDEIEHEEDLESILNDIEKVRK